MSNVLGGPFPRQPTRAGTQTEWVVLHRPLQRILAFTRRSIDDVVNDPVAKNEVLGYYKLQRWIARGIEIGDLERQWNG